MPMDIASKHLLEVFTFYKDPDPHFTWYLSIGRREQDLSLTSVESLAAVSEDETDQSILCVLMHDHPLRWRTVECFVFTVASNVRNHCFVLDKAKCHLVGRHIWARH